MVITFAFEETFHIKKDASKLKGISGCIYT